MDSAEKTATSHLPGFRKIASENVLSLLDQVIVSLTSLLTMVMVGRVSKVELGVFAFGNTIVLMIVSATESLICLPYTSLVSRRGDPRLFTGSSMVGLAILATIISSVLGVALLSIGFGVIKSSVTPLLMVLAFTMPLNMLRLFVRRVSFAFLNVRQSLRFDTLASVFQLSLLTIFWQSGYLDATVGHLSIGIASMAIAVLWLWTQRNSYKIDFGQAMPQLRDNWRFARSVFQSQISFILHFNVLIWSLAYWHGQPLAGEFSACLTTILLANPFVQGILNVLAPRASRAFEQGGHQAVRRVVWMNTVLMVGGVVLLWMGLILFGDQLISWVFGSVYGGQQLAISILGVSMLGETACKASESGLIAIERPSLVFFVNLIRLAVTVVCLMLLVPYNGIVGAACSLAIADTLAAIMFIVGFVAATSPKRAVQN